MRRFLFKFLIMFVLVAGVEGFLAGLAYGGPPPAHDKSSLKSRKKRVAAKKKHHRKRGKRSFARRSVPRQKSITVLREYLPEYADVHETKSKDQIDTPLPLPVRFDRRSPFAQAETRYDLIKNIDRWLGTRYRFGGSSKRGIDCSGFTSSVVSATLRQGFYGSSRVMAQRFVPIFTVDSLQFGDLLFFTGRNRKSDRIGHVGIYLGNGVFAHSSTGRGVIYTHISEGYYTDRFRWGGRFLTNDLTAFNRVETPQVH
jgi:cell wall-associated NlpC family hydrolase